MICNQGLWPPAKYWKVWADQNFSITKKILKLYSGLLLNSFYNQVDFRGSTWSCCSHLNVSWKAIYSTENPFTPHITPKNGKSVSSTCLHVCIVQLCPKQQFLQWAKLPKSIKSQSQGEKCPRTTETTVSDSVRPEAKPLQWTNSRYIVGSVWAFTNPEKTFSILLWVWNLWHFTYFLIFF